MNSSSAPAIGAAAGAGAGAGAGVDVAAAMVPANNARTRKLRQVYKNIFRTVNNFPTTLPPLTKSLYKGALCDPIGYSQHGGECWSDTLQQLILFSDELKDYTQPYYYNTPYTTIAMKIDIFVEESLRDIVKQYVQAMQTRFINHYNLIATANPEFESCVSAPDYRRTMIHSDKFKLYRQQSFVSALESARSVVGWEEEKSGAYTKQYETLFNILVMLTDADTSIDIKPVDEIEPGSKVYSYFLSTVYYDVQGSLGKTALKEELFVIVKGGHVVGFFKCGGKLYFYDDNRGSIETNLPFSDISKLSGILIDRDTNNVLFLRGSVQLYIHGLTVAEFGAEKSHSLVINTPLIWNTDRWESFNSDILRSGDYALCQINQNYALVSRSKRIYPLVPTSKLTSAAPTNVDVLPELTASELAALELELAALGPAEKSRWRWPWSGGRKRSTRAARQRRGRRHTRRGKHLR